MNYSALSWVHIGSSILALMTGLAVLLRTKGTRTHRRIGYAYVASMITLNLTSLFIFSLTGRFSPFHVMAILSLAIVIAGFVPVFLRRPAGGWLELHLHFIAWSYIGLLAAAASEAAVRIPRAPFWWAVIASAAVIIMAGAILLAHNRPRLLARYQRR